MQILSRSQHQGIFQENSGSWLKQLHLSEWLFCACLISIFIPIKVYPLVFLGSGLVFFRETPGWLKEKWVYCMALFALYATGSFLLTYRGDWNAFVLTNIVKLIINFGFLYIVVSWLASRDNTLLLKLLDIVLLVIFLLTLVQLYIYHQAYDFQLISGNVTSGRASALYRDSLFYWGLDDKNMFGARIALLGFVYIMLPVVRGNKISVWRILFIFLLAYLSLSRTPIVALIIGVFSLLFLSAGRWGRIASMLVLVAGLPFVLQKLIRIENLTSSNDGMGIRLNYWKAFFLNLDAIPPWGIGFLRSQDFMVEYAAYYRGEHHLHNTFFSCYLELGVIGLLSFVFFLIYFFMFSNRMKKQPWFWTVAALPLLAIMMILYSGYDNDVVIYLALIFLLGSMRLIDFSAIKIRI